MAGIIRIVLLGCLFTLSVGQLPAQGPRKFGTISTLKPEEQRLLALALADFRNNRKDPAKRTDAVDRALGYGKEGAERLLTVITAELEPLVRRYRDNFTRRAQSVAREKLKTVKVKEVEELRADVLALKADEQLTKERIVSVADPAVARLGELLLMDRAEILAQAADLQKERATLTEPGGYWEKAMIALYQATPETDRPAQAPSFDEFLSREETLAVRLAGPIDDKARQVLAFNSRQESNLDPEEARCILELNLLRILLGLNALAIDIKLVAAGRDHSKDMQEKNFFAHESPVPGKKTPWDRAKNFGTEGSAENIFVGSPQGRDAHLAWFHSPGHHKNMLGNHQRVGVGNHQRHWTQMFGR